MRSPLPPPVLPPLQLYPPLLRSMLLATVCRVFLPPAHLKSQADCRSLAFRLTCAGSAAGMASFFGQWGLWGSSAPQAQNAKPYYLTERVLACVYGGCWPMCLLGARRRCPHPRRPSPLCFLRSSCCSTSFLLLTVALLYCYKRALRTFLDLQRRTGTRGTSHTGRRSSPTGALSAAGSRLPSLPPCAACSGATQLP